MDSSNTASLFGLKNSNRDFSKVKSWGKNQFNSAFPASLCCYLESKSLKANYCNIEDDNFVICEKDIEAVYGTTSLEKSNRFFSFETMYTPYQRYVKGNIPRTDLVIQDLTTGNCLRGLEIKLTALPDHNTCELIDSKYGSEIVVRPDTIVYLTCSIIESIGDRLQNILGLFHLTIDDWTDPQEVIQNVEIINKCIGSIALKIKDNNTPFLLQPIWKTKGKSPKLSDYCLDVFIWSNSAFCYFISKNSSSDVNAKKINRHTRTSIWLYKMLSDYVEYGFFDHEKIIDALSFNTKNDKAFASSGIITNKYMQCDNLTKPRITKGEIKKIILGGGQNLLSPERRFDAIIYNSPELFKVNTVDA